jgi:hypothetical protein
MQRFHTSRLVALGALCCLSSLGQKPAQADEPILTNLPAHPLNVSTVPPIGDVNPYGVAFVPHGFPRGGPLHPGDILVSNFNDGDNTQGTGRTIMKVTPDGSASVFFQGPKGLGLTTALGVLKAGLVLVGNVPTTDKGSTVHQGSLLILDRFGRVIADLSDEKLLDGPWDLTVHDRGWLAQIFISNVLSGTVTRLDLIFRPFGRAFFLDATQIASGYLHRPDMAALVVGPTGLAYDADKDRLYVASAGDNTIFAIPHAGRRFSDAGKGRIVYQDDAHLRGPLGLVLAPNGDLITANGDAVNGDPAQPSELVEFTPEGHFVAQVSVDTGGQGGAFGIAIATSGDNIRFAAVDDINNTLDVWTLER